MKAPEVPTLGKLSVLVMPNGELICMGKTVGWLSECGQHVKLEEDSAYGMTGEL
jgi:hypothetical protein